MQRKGRRRIKTAGELAVIILAAVLAGCGGSSGEEPATAAPQTGTYVEKERPQENRVSDNMAVYADDDENSVVTMYLTVRQGTEGDNTNHTWTEINTYSAYYYDDNEIPRYNCEALLQIGDENGPAEGEFGYGETVANAAVQIRGQTSSKREQKNYKIRIKEEKGSWRGQRTIALNKHVGDPVRFRNKLAYDLMKNVPEMISARTQFVHLYVKDETEGGNGVFTDYGLYTQVEQMNKTYLKNHGLDNRGHLYKINFFEWYRYDALKLKSDPDYDEAAFEKYIEIKGNDDHTKLLDLLDKISDYSIPIEDIVEQNFDSQNICYWMAFHILTGNYDVGSRNYYIYSPLNSEKWYFISWDNDAAFSRTYHEWKDYSEGKSWEQGMTQFLHSALFERMFKVDRYRAQLSAAVEDLRANYLNREIMSQKISEYSEVVKPYVYRLPDLTYSMVSQENYDMLLNGMADETETNYQYFLESLERPWPFFVGTPYVEDGRLEVLWDTSFDMDNESITYSFALATDYSFQNILVQEEGLRLPEMTFDLLPPGQYFIRVRAKNASGYEQDCYDYYSMDSGGKAYGAKCFYVNEDGTITEHENTEGNETE